MTKEVGLLQAFKWSIASELAAKAIQPLIFLTLASLLTPDDFGVLTAALMVIGFSQIFWDAGMAKALIQRQTDLRLACDVAFWINTVLSVGISFLLLVLAEPIAHSIFRDARVTPVLQIMTLQVLLGAAASVHTALLQKEMRFQQLFWVRFISVTVPGVASLPLAWAGMSYWALVAGALVGQLAQTAMLWRISKWRPQFSFSPVVGKEMLTFGGWVGMTSLLAWFYAWGDSFIVGMYLSGHELGIYRTGSHFVLMLYAIIFSPIVPVLYSHLSKMNGDAARIGNTLARAIRAMALVSIPISVIIYFLSESIGVALFSPEWSGIGFIIGVMALTHGVSWLMALNGDAYRAMGKPSVEAIVPALMLGIYLVTYIVFIQRGLESFVWARLALAIAAFLLHLLLAQLIVSISAWSLVRSFALISILSVLVVFIVNAYLVNHLPTAWLKVVVVGASSALILALIFYHLERHRIVRDIISLVRTRSL